MKSQWLQSEATLPIVIEIFKFSQLCAVNIFFLHFFISCFYVNRSSICSIKYMYKRKKPLIPLVQPLLKLQRVEGDIFPSIHVSVFIFKLPLCMFLNWFNEPLSLDVKLQMSQNFGIKCLSMSLYSAGGDRENLLHSPEILLPAFTIL